MSKVFVSGGAGFIGSHICEKLLELNNEVICFDNLITGSKENIEHLDGKEGFVFIEGDLRNESDVKFAIQGCSHVCHQAALGSVPRSIENPILTNDINIVGSLNLLFQSVENSVQRFVYASSSSVYGDNLEMPKREENTGRPLSPYAVTKSALEQYSRVFNDIYEIDTIGLRYFNVFGPRQSPEGAYAAVIPIFLKFLLEGKSPVIFGDGKQTRDFTYVKNSVDANILALFGDVPEAYGKTFNVACGSTFSINDIFNLIHENLEDVGALKEKIRPTYGPKRTGDILDSLANLDNIKKLIGYSPAISVEEGIRDTVRWFVNNFE